MTGIPSALPEGGPSLPDARAVSPGLYISKKVLPADTRKYFKVRLNESETLEINVMGADQGGVASADIYPTTGSPMTAYVYARLQQGSVSWLPPKPGWVPFSIGNSNYVNAAGSVYGGLH
jgi:hypothetical protein